MACYQEIVCPACGSNEITKSGCTEQGTQRYRCKHEGCTTKTFLLDYRYNAYKPGVKRQVVDMASNGSGIRDTSRVLSISKNTVISTLKKSPRY
jgi:transposase-like protein